MTRISTRSPAKAEAHRSRERRKVARAAEKKTSIQNLASSERGPGWREILERGMRTHRARPRKCHGPGLHVGEEKTPVGTKTVPSGKTRERVSGSLHNRLITPAKKDHEKKEGEKRSGLLKRGWIPKVGPAIQARCKN